MSIAYGFIAISNALHKLLAHLPGFTLLTSSLLLLFGANEIDLNVLNKQPLFTLETPSWQKYVRASPGSVIEPLYILPQYTKGNVSNPLGLINGGSPTVLTRIHLSNIRPTIVVDFGQNTVGIVSIEFAGSTNYSSGRPGIRLAFSETLGFLSDVSDFSRSYNGDTITPGSDQIAVGKHPYTWTSQHGCQHGNKVCSDGLHGFRYMKIYLDALDRDSPYTSSIGSVAINSITLKLSAFLGTPDTFTGWFESSNKRLNQWWYDSVYTNDLCTDIFLANNTEPRNAASPSLEGKWVIHDGPKRDRDPYVGDLAVASRTSYLTHNISVASRNVLADLAEHQRSDGWIPPASINDYSLPLMDYPLWWVACSYDYFMHTGDVDYVEKYYEVMVKTLDNFYPSITNSTNQLITKGLGVSGGYGDYAFLQRTGAVTYYNALYVIALDNAAFIANSIGQGKDAERWTARAQNVSVAINKYRFDTLTGAFFDGDCGTSPCRTHAQDGNSLAIVSGVANSTRAKSVLRYLSKNARPYGNAFYDNDLIGGGFSQRVYPFISYFELEARFMTGDAESALEEINRLYGWMATHDPGVTVWEGIGSNGEPYEGGFTSLAHGWSTGIVPVAMNYLLGVKPSGPGFKTWSVKPVFGDLKWARGVVPTPNGPIEVSWKRNEEFVLSVKAPEGTEGRISVPASRSSVVYLNSDLVWRSDGGFGELEDDGYTSFDVDGGHHVVTVVSQMRDEV